jgi:hypothetical protein
LRARDSHCLLELDGATFVLLADALVVIGIFLAPATANELRWVMVVGRRVRPGEGREMGKVLVRVTR